MPKMEKIHDANEATLPLRITRRKARRTGPSRTISPRIRVKCGCCDETLEICTDTELTGNPNLDTLEINGVSGTVDQWRKVFGPLLGFREARVREKGQTRVLWLQDHPNHPQ